jgi:hypothetical protein
MKLLKFLLITFVLGIMAFSSFPPQRENEPPQLIRLKSRQFTPATGIEPAILEALKKTPLAKIHAFIQLPNIPDLETKKILENDGIELLFHIQPKVWTASLPKASFLKKSFALPEAVIWLGEILPTDKIAPDIKMESFPKWAVEPNGDLKLTVVFFKDVAQKNARAILEKYASYIKDKERSNGWKILSPRKTVEEIAGHDEVQWIEIGPPPFLPFNNYTRQRVHVDEAQDVDLGSGKPVYYGLSGAGVHAGVWDSGIDMAHEDFQGRISVTFTPPRFPRNHGGGSHRRQRLSLPILLGASLPAPGHGSRMPFLGRLSGTMGPER